MARPDAQRQPASTARPGRAVLLACFAALGFAVMFALLKAAGPRFPTVQLVFFRSAFAFLPFLPVFVRSGVAALRTRRPGIHALRALFGVTSMACNFYALVRIPLADLTATQFAMPLFLTLLSMPLLGESVGWRRLTATAVGFVGVLLILRPGGEGVDWVYLVALTGAFLYALVAVTIRRLGTTDPAITTFFYFTLACTLSSGLLLPFVWVTPTAAELLLLVLAGVAGGLAQYAMVDAYRHAPATIVAPFDYTQIVWATLFGIMLFAEIPDGWVIAGALVVAGSGLYIWHRESTLARRAG